MSELQRTYRGSAERDEAERRLPTDDGPECAVLIASVSGTPEDEADRLEEMAELLRTAGARVRETLVQRRDRPDPRTYLGKGRLEDLDELVRRIKPDLIAAEGELSPGQQRQLEDRLRTRVVDRTGVILDIFAQHAGSAAAKTQVELAQLEYSYQRQEGLWQHLERLGGGVGTRGPGETQLESDRRVLRSRMGALRRKLRDIARAQDVSRDRRMGSDLTRVAIAGYTNAGKSSLMNALTGADVQVDDALFETLDATTRAIERAGVRVLVSDTVGFIRHLPHQLVESFASTLDEVRDAHLILHVVDASEDEERRGARARAVEAVLDDIGAGEVPRIPVLNKVDLLDAEDRAALRHRHPDGVSTSAATGEGVEELRDLLMARARARLSRLELFVPYARGEVISRIYAVGREVEQEPRVDGTLVRALMSPADAERVRAALAGEGGGPQTM